MLVLSRKVNESIVIADSIVVTITRLERGQVRLGIEAPPEVRVLRGELTQEPQERFARPVMAGARS